MPLPDLALFRRFWEPTGASPGKAHRGPLLADREPTCFCYDRNEEPPRFAGVGPLSQIAVDPVTRPANAGSLSALSLSALGVVFGDIGTSPLYTLKTVLGLAGGTPDAAATLGVLSLVIWTLIVITTIKYVFVAMRVDNDGEGGILALMSLLGVKRQHRRTIIAVGLFGAALIYGDGAITPAISVLSALEGLEIVLPAFAPYVLPLAILILVALFAVQPQGIARIGRAFGPIMALWFAVIALLGIWGISQHPSVLIAIDPRYGLSCLTSGGATGFLVLGGVFLCVTAPRRCTPIWGISARGRSNSPGPRSSFRASC